ncbi:hypothetical protein Cni_G10130 [Canna indica]|uniref:Pentatricopeptide repeat-containing protein n=1 Tax=Canna indica TaxID=4628 RepID=A0AAQ3K597_9LILI|nr:hypothetical protein Cni_G10130 [Canna indica]
MTVRLRATTIFSLTAKRRLLSPCRLFSVPTFPPTPVDPSLRLATVLYQQQHAPDATLNSHLRKLPLPSSPPHLHELFLQICNRFPFSWRPVHRFQLFLLHSLPSSFAHTPVSASKMLSVYGRARNVDLLWRCFLDASAASLLSPGALCVAAAALADAREIKKCVEIFHHVSAHHDSLCNIDSLNRVVETLCQKKLPDVAKVLVWKLKPLIAPDEATYRSLVVGFCRAGDLVEASRVWNRMFDESIEPDAESYEEIVATMFKNNRLEDAMQLFKSLRERRYHDLGLPSYRVVISWMCKEGRIMYALMLLGEMLKRGVGADNVTLGALVYGLLVRRKVREGYKVFEGAAEPDISLYHGLIKGLLWLRRAEEATQVFRTMIESGCEPVMHTYIMLLQGHLGKRGRKEKDSLVNFDSIFVGGLVKAGRTLQATKYAERMMWGSVKVPKFDYNKFLHYFSNEEGVVMFEEVGKRLKDIGLIDLGDVFLRYGERMATRERRRRARSGLIIDCDAY